MKVERLFKVFFIHNEKKGYDDPDSFDLMYVFYSRHATTAWTYYTYDKKSKGDRKWVNAEEWHKIKINEFPFLECVYDLRISRAKRRR